MSKSPISPISDNACNIFHDTDGGSSSLIITTFDDGSATLAIQDPELSDHLSAQISLDWPSVAVLRMIFERMKKS